MVIPYLLLDASPLDSQLSRADARSDCELLPCYFPKHPLVKKFNVTRIHLANYSPTLWFPGHRRTIYRFF